MIRLFTVAVLAMTVAPIPAWTQSRSLPQLFGGEHEEDWVQCLNGNPDVALNACTAVIDAHLDPPADLAVAFNNRGNIFYHRDEFDRAIFDYSEAIQRRPDFARAFNNRGNAYVAKQEYDLAIADFSQAIGMKPGNVTSPHDPPPFNAAATLINRGILYSRKGSYNQAIVDFTEAIRMEPGDAGAFYNRGIAYNNIGNYDLALEDYNKSIELKPHDAYALYARSIARQKKGDVAGADADRTAALKIDSDVAGKVVSTAVSTNAAGAASTQSPSAANQTTGAVANPASCAVAPVGAVAASYVDDSDAQLKKAVPALRGVKFEAAQNASGNTTAAPAQDEVAPILNRSGSLIVDLLHKMPDLIAKEEVMETTETGGYRTSSISAGRRGQMAVQSVVGAKEQTKTYSYRIVHKKDAGSDDALNEFRTDLHDKPVANSVKDPDSPQGLGFATSWLYFIPGIAEESRFRYVGQQKVGNRETYVLAFAQVPEKAHMLAVIEAPNGPCTTLTQGVAWIDQSTFEIVRMETDLRAPLIGIQMDQLRSMLNYSEVRIPERDMTLWLPKEVSITWHVAGQTREERHLYSHYRLFEATVRILPTEENPKP